MLTFLLRIPYMYCVPRMLFILRHYIKDLLHACNHYHFSNCRSTVNVNVIMHLPVSYKLTCIYKFMYMQACLASSINTCMLITPKHCHNVAMGMSLVAQLTVINIADIRSTFDKTLASECFHRNAVDGAP